MIVPVLRLLLFCWFRLADVLLLYPFPGGKRFFLLTIWCTVDSRSPVCILVAEHLWLLARLLMIHLREFLCLGRNLLPGYGFGLLEFLLRDVQGHLILGNICEGVGRDRILFVPCLEQACFLGEEDEGNATLAGTDQEVGDFADFLILLVDDRRILQLACQVGFCLPAGSLELLLDLLGELLGLLLGLLLLDSRLGESLLDLLLDLLPLRFFLDELLGKALNLLLRFLLLNARLGHGLFEFLFDLLGLLLHLLLASLALLL